jgi:acetate kinase
VTGRGPATACEAVPPTPGILTLNAGSSSLKFSVFAIPGGGTTLPLVQRGEIDGIGATPRLVVTDASGRRLADRPLGGATAAPPDHEGALQACLAWIEEHGAGITLCAAGHRVVHGGGRFSAPVMVDAPVLEELGRLEPLAPLHQPHNLAPIRSIARLMPGLPQVACFDTAFHGTQPAVAQAYALPRALSEAGIRRYGFHGLSYEYIARALPGVLAGVADGRVVVAHLGNGASLCALRHGRSVATTMGFSVLDGLPMGTRCGALDPGVILYLLTERGMTVSAVSDVLYHQSGLLGVSGISHDMRELLASPSPDAARAIELFVYRIARELGSLAAALGGLEALVFTGGIGEHAAPIRARVCEASRWLGIALDEATNERGGPRISADGSAVGVWVIPTDEEQMMGQHTRTLLDL